MRIVYNKIIPFPGYIAINLFGVLFVRSKYKDRLSDVDINHEEIHTHQMRELGYVLFYVLYFIEWLVRLFINDNAYRSISFEREAYANEFDLDYLSGRKHYAWMKYFKA